MQFSKAHGAHSTLAAAIYQPCGPRAMSWWEGVTCQGCCRSCSRTFPSVPGGTASEGDKKDGRTLCLRCVLLGT